MSAQYGAPRGLRAQTEGAPAGVMVRRPRTARPKPTVVAAATLGAPALVIAMLALFGAVGAGSEGPGVDNLSGTPGLQGATTPAPPPRASVNRSRESEGHPKRNSDSEQAPKQEPVRQTQPQTPQRDQAPAVSKLGSSVVVPQTAESGPGAPMPDSGTTSGDSTDTSSGSTGSGETPTHSDSNTSYGG
jgi:hypothetical protein